MLTPLLKRRSIRTLLAVVVFTLVLAAAIALSPARKACALPCHEVEHDYYSDDTYTTQVGVRYVTCSGVYTYGTVTIYVVSYDGDCCPSCCSK